MAPGREGTGGAAGWELSDCTAVTKPRLDSEEEGLVGVECWDVFFWEGGLAGGDL